MLELASGIDALYLSGKAIVPIELLDRLDAVKEEARELESPVGIEFGGVPMLMRPSAWGKYRFWLVHRHGQIGITPSEKLPPIKIQPKSEFLHGLGPRAAVDWFRCLVLEECPSLSLTASRLDLHADWQGWNLTGDDRHYFLCRADSRVTREVGEAFTGLEYGRRKTNTVLCRIYDKTEEIKLSGAGYWPEIWGPSRDEALPVLRIEFEIGRSGLKQFGITSPEEAIDGAPALWAYCTDEWMSHRSPVGDQTKSRWPISEQWDHVRRSALRADAHGLKRMYQGRTSGELWKIAPGLFGYLSQLAALAGTTSVEDVAELLPVFAAAYQERSGRDFRAQVSEKRMKLGWP